MKIPDTVQNAVLMPSSKMDANDTQVAGYDFNQGVDYSTLFRSVYSRIGYQATELGKAIHLVDSMVTTDHLDSNLCKRNWRLSDDSILEDANDAEKNPEFRAATKCKIFLGYTSNLVSSGLRDMIRFLAQHKMIDVIVSTAGGIEEDFIKCLAPTYILNEGFRANGAALRKKGLNRIGNLVVPNDNYCAFEEWIMPIFDQCLHEQRTQGVHWTPSKLIHRLGKEINHPDSIYYWCYKNDIPVYSPALTDGSLGDMLYFHSFKNPGLILDIVQDIRGMNMEAVHAHKTGMIILGGGLVKHHICNANLMRNGADYALYINTGQEFDGSDAGAHPDEAVSWGKIRADAQSVKICADATLVFPIIVAETFAREFSKSDGNRGL